MKHLKLFTLLAFSSFFIACNTSTEHSDNNNTAEIENLVEAWNTAHNENNIEALATLYADNVNYYQSEETKNACLQSKLSLFEKYPSFEQLIAELELMQNEDAYTATFNKVVTIKDDTKIYPSYLILEAFDDGWRITAESDSVTDHNLNKPKVVGATIPEDAVEGDFNGDDKIDYVWVEQPEFPKATAETEEGDLHGACVGECNCYLVFSDNTIPRILIEGCIGGTPENLGDLNGNGMDEIGLVPRWWQGCHMRYIALTNLNGKYAYLVEEFPIHCNQFEDEIAEIAIDKENDGQAIIQYVDYEGEMWEIKTKSVEMAK